MSLSHHIVVKSSQNRIVEAYRSIEEVTQVKNLKCQKHHDFYNGVEDLSVTNVGNNTLFNIFL